MLIVNLAWGIDPSIYQMYQIPTFKAQTLKAQGMPIEWHSDSNSEYIISSDNVFYQYFRQSPKFELMCSELGN
jgi:hypothetical protein